MVGKWDFSEHWEHEKQLIELYESDIGKYLSFEEQETLFSVRFIQEKRSGHVINLSYVEGLFFEIVKLRKYVGLLLREREKQFELDDEEK